MAFLTELSARASIVVRWKLLRTRICLLQVQFPQRLTLPSSERHLTFSRLPARREGWLRQALRGRARLLIVTWRLASVYLAKP
jgi:hypothetical protein